MGAEAQGILPEQPQEGLSRQGNRLGGVLDQGDLPDGQRLFQLKGKDGSRLQCRLGKFPGHKADAQIVGGHRHDKVYRCQLDIRPQGQLFLLEDLLQQLSDRGSLPQNQNWVVTKKGADAALDLSASLADNNIVDGDILDLALPTKAG